MIITKITSQPTKNIGFKVYESDAGLLRKIASKYFDNKLSDLCRTAVAEYIEKLESNCTSN